MKIKAIVLGLIVVLGLIMAMPAEAKRCDAGKSGQHNKHCAVPTTTSAPLPTKDRCSMPTPTPYPGGPGGGGCNSK